MRRREFIIGTVVSSVLGYAQPVCAQADARSFKKRIAIFHPTEKPEGLTINGRRAYKSFFRELNRLGYVEGKNLIVERYSGLGQLDRYGDLARDIVGGRPDVIITLTGTFALRLKQLTATIPIITLAADPIKLGLVTSIGRPEGNITGVSIDAGLEIWGKRLQVLNEATGDHLRRICFLTFGTPYGRSYWEMVGATISEAAQRAGMTILPAFVEGSINKTAYEAAFEEVQRKQVDGLVVSDAPDHVTNRGLIVDLASAHRLPVVYPFREFVEVGGLLAYGVDTADATLRLADMTDQVLRGASPGDIPFYQQVKFELVLNRTTANLLGLKFPATLLAVADEVIG